MWREPRIIGEGHWPRIFWKFGWFFEFNNGMPYMVMGVGILALEIHVLPWGNNFDVDVFVNSPVGHIGVNFDMMGKKEEDDDTEALQEVR